MAALSKGGHANIAAPGPLAPSGNIILLAVDVHTLFLDELNEVTIYEAEICVFTAFQYIKKDVQFFSG
jgi:hypothetical protein